MALHEPIIGRWFRQPDGTEFEVVAIDEDAATVEIQLFDATIDEIDVENWPTLMLIEIAAPEDLVLVKGSRSSSMEKIMNCGEVAV